MNQKESKLKKNVVEVIEEGMYINLYQKYIKIPGYVEGMEYTPRDATTKMVSFTDFILQLDAINRLYPDLVLVNYKINLISPNYFPTEKKVFGHNTFGIDHEFHMDNPLKTVVELIEQIRWVYKHLEENFEDENKDMPESYFVQSCNILCINPKKKPKTKKISRTHISKSIRHEVFKRDDYKCKECGCGKDDTVLHVDHIKPISQGGTDELDNLQTLCEECNLAKSDRFWKSDD